MRVDNGKSFQEKKIHGKNIDFLSKKLAPKKGPYAVSSFVINILSCLNINIIKTYLQLEVYTVDYHSSN